MLVHIHIPKNAGTTIDHLLKRKFKDHYFEYYTDREGKFLSNQEFLELINNLPASVKCLSGHYIRPLELQKAKALNINYFTFIRDPIKRAISLYYFEQARTDKSHISHGSFSQYVEERPKQDNAISNWQVYNLTEDGQFESARNILDSFLFVGLVEEFDKSLILLNDSLQKNALTTLGTYYVPQNTSKNKILSKSTIDKKTLCALECLNEQDLLLYSHVKSELERRWQSLSLREIKLGRTHLICER